MGLFIIDLEFYLKSIKIDFHILKTIYWVHQTDSLRLQSELKDEIFQVFEIDLHV